MTYSLPCPADGGVPTACPAIGGGATTANFFKYLLRLLLI